MTRRSMKAFCEFPVAAMMRALPFPLTAWMINSAARLAAAAAELANESKTRTLAVPARKSKSDSEACMGTFLVLSEKFIQDRYPVGEKAAAISLADHVPLVTGLGEICFTKPSRSWPGTE